MTIQEFRDYMASGKPVVGGGEVHMMFHQLSQEALKITAEINGKYHTPEQLHDLLEQLWGREVPKTVGMFPPFHTDCGKNTIVGERVFINMGCKFQDQGGITIDEGALIGHNVLLATINHDLDPAYGLKTCSASNTSLLNNFEIVATALIALLFFGESVKRKLWIAIMLVTVASILLSLEDGNMSEALAFSQGSLLVLGATICWGLENNCTRQIADRDPMEIVTVKGFGSGLGALLIAVCVGSEFPTFKHIAIILLLGYVAYGLSIYFYTYVQRTIGAAKTSTYYALAPFIGALLSILLLGEPVTIIFIIASILMAAGCWIAAK